MDLCNFIIVKGRNCTKMSYKSCRWAKSRPTTTEPRATPGRRRSRGTATVPYTTPVVDLPVLVRDLDPAVVVAGVLSVLLGRAVLSVRLGVGGQRDDA